MPVGWSEESLFNEVMIVPRMAFVPHLDTEIIERPGFRQLITPSFRQGGLNEVSFSILDDDRADAVIAETIERYRSLGLRFRWFVAPGSRPDDLAERLSAHGLRRVDLLGMYRETAGASAHGGGEVTVEEVSLAVVDEFTRAMAAGWGIDPAPLRLYHCRILADPARRCRMLLGRVSGEPAGAASCFVFERSVYLGGAVVLPAFRRRGVYRALIAERLRLAAERGVRLATSHARADASAPLLARLGFTALCSFPVFSSD